MCCTVPFLVASAPSPENAKLAAAIVKMPANISLKRTDFMWISSVGACNAVIYRLQGRNSNLNRAIGSDFSVSLFNSVYAGDETHSLFVRYNGCFMDFKLVSSYAPRGDQKTAIEQLVNGLGDEEKHQVLLGVTGSGKTFTMAKVIERLNRPSLVLAHNKTLAAQLYHEFRGFFPENAVEYFVSYYDYYQPEAYIAATDTYIEKESTINDEIDRLRLSATRSLFERR